MASFSLTLRSLGVLLIVMCAATLVSSENNNGSPFLESPQNASVPIGKNATFICSTMMEDNVVWLVEINGTIYDPHHRRDDSNLLRQRGIIIDPEERYISNNRTLTIPATKENNQTQVKCRLQVTVAINREATLTVIGITVEPSLALTALPTLPPTSTLIITKVPQGSFSPAFPSTRALPSPLPTPVGASPSPQLDLDLHFTNDTPALFGIGTIITIWAILLVATFSLTIQ